MAQSVSMPRSAPGLLPAATGMLAIAGAAFGLIVGELGAANLLFAAVLVLAGLVAGFALHQQLAGAKAQAPLPERATESVRASPPAEAYLVSLHETCGGLLSRWERHIKLSREQTESALVGLTQEFSAISGKLENAVAASRSAAGSLGRADGVLPSLAAPWGGVSLASGGRAPLTWTPTFPKGRFANSRG